MATIGERVAPKAATIIAAEGRLVTLRKPSTGFAAATGVMTRTTSDTTVSAVILPASKTGESLAADRYADGTLVEIGDQKFLIAAQGLASAPEAGDQIITDGETFTIKHVDGVKPGTTPVLYRGRMRIA